MNSESLENFIHDDSELSLHEDYLNSLIKPSVDISFSTDAPKIGESRFGGPPFVSKGFVWPSHEKGEYRFLGQINFSEIEERTKSLPCDGLLSLFYAYDEGGEVFWGDDGYVLGYYWPKTEDLALFAETDSNFEAKKIVFTLGNEIPRQEDLRTDWPFQTDALYDLQDLEGYCEDYMLGYPSFYSLAYDPTPSDDWVSLITLASNDELGWNWHDGGKLMIFIEESKLQNKDFSGLITDAG